VTETEKAERLREEAAWVGQALAGDPRGFEDLMRRYHGPLGRLLRGILRNAQDAEDLMQETFLRAYRYLHRFDTGRPFGPWLLRIGANLARNHLRRRKTRREVSLDDQSAQGGEERFEGEWLADLSTVDEIEYRELRGRVRRAVASLPEDQRVVLEMRLLAEMSYKEIATALEIPIGTVMSRLNRGRKRIQAELAERPAAAEALEGS
jgi:RNA polymerase sigma-70 factor (ECF subfamily)